MEEKRIIPSFPDYAITLSGEVWRVGERPRQTRWKELPLKLKPKMMGGPKRFSAGYTLVDPDGNHKSKLATALVREAWGKEIEGK